jgi:hypothetical protein
MRRDQRIQIAELEAALGRELRAATRLDGDPRAAEHAMRAGTLRRRINLLVLELASNEEQK